MSNFQETKIKDCSNGGSVSDGAVEWGVARLRTCGEYGSRNGAPFEGFVDLVLVVVKLEFAVREGSENSSPVFLEGDGPFAMCGHEL